MSQVYPTAFEKSIHASWRMYVGAVRLLRGAPSVTFAERGYVQGVLDSLVVDALHRALASADFMTMEAEDYLPGFRRSEKIYRVKDSLNAGHRFYRLGEQQLRALSHVLDQLREPVAAAIGSPWSVVNVRVLETLPTADHSGPNFWHGDGFPPDILKAMIYVTAASDQTGTTEFRRDDGTAEMVVWPPGTWVLFKNSVIIHRGVPPTIGNRVAAEITLVPSFRFDLTPVVSGLNATYPEYPWSLNRVLRGVSEIVAHPLRERYRRYGKTAKEQARKAKSQKPPKPAKPVKPVKAVRPAEPAEVATRAKQEAKSGAQDAARTKDSRLTAKAKKAKEKKRAAHIASVRKAARLTRLRALVAINRLFPPVAVNIGGGPEFAQFRWLNLDAASGPANPRRFPLSVSSTFPLEDGAVDTVYTSHCIEHLDDATVERVLGESQRVLKEGGRLVIKIPDFDMVLERWRNGDVDFFADDRWGFRRLKETWPVLGVRDTIDYRAAMIFCGVWNRAYGHHFTGRSPGEGAYHGPAPVDVTVLQRLKAESSPHTISAVLRASVLQLPEPFTFNHQNGWSRKELTALLDRAGLDLVSFDPETVIAAGRDINGIVTARRESLYCLARKRA